MPAPNAMGPKTAPTHPAPSSETTPATGLASTPGDYGFAVGDPIGRYVVLERLGGGGMGVVYSAYDPKLDRRVALKLLRPDVSGNGDAQKRLLREGQTLARLAHPNVVNVHDLGEFEGRVFVNMEFVKGSTLTEWLHARARSWREIVDVFVQAGRGLAAAHAVGIVHRDFKPDNVLVGDDGRVRVADFGIALLARSDVTLPARMPAPEDVPDSKTDDPVVTDPERGASVVQGTLPYMAPEQIVGRAAGRALGPVELLRLPRRSAPRRAPVRGGAARQPLRARGAGALAISRHPLLGCAPSSFAASGPIRTGASRRWKRSSAPSPAIPGRGGSGSPVLSRCSSS